MGYQFQNVCYPSTAAAADAFFSSAPPATVAGSTTYLTEYTKPAGSWLASIYKISGGTTELLSQSSAPVPAFPVCSELDAFKDGATIGWGVAAAVVAAWCIKFLARGASR